MLYPNSDNVALDRKLYKLQSQTIILLSELGYNIDYNAFTEESVFNPNVIITLLTYTQFDKRYLSDKQREDVRQEIRKII